MKRDLAAEKQAELDAAAVSEGIVAPIDPSDDVPSTNVPSPSTLFNQHLLRSQGPGLTPSAKKRPVPAPPAKKPRLEDIVAGAVAEHGSQRILAFSEALMVHLDDNAADHLKAKLSVPELQQVQNVGGIYWKVAEEDGKGIFKAEDGNMCLFHHSGQDGGWYLSAKFWQGDAEYKALHDDVLIGWCGTTAMPEKVHLPYWAKKPCPGASVVPYTLWLRARIASNS